MKKCSRIVLQCFTIDLVKELLKYLKWSEEKNMYAFHLKYEFISDFFSKCCILQCTAVKCSFLFLRIKYPLSEISLLSCAIN